MPPINKLGVRIAVPSYGRADNIVRRKNSTSVHITPRYWPLTTYYVEPEEVETYRQALQTLTNRGGDKATLVTADRADVPKKWGSIMDLIIDEGVEQCDRLMIMDDDLKLAVRPSLPEEPTVFAPMTDKDFDRMVEELCKVCTSETPLVSTQYRQFCHCAPDHFSYNGRISMIWMLHSKFFKDHPEFRFYRQSRLDFMSDYYFYVNLLQAGYRNVCVNRYTKDDKPNAPGGEKEKRTIEVFNRAVKQFASFFPRYVRVREKKGKNNWQDGMLGVSILGAKAYQEGTYRRMNRE